MLPTLSRLRLSIGVALAATPMTAFAQAQTMSISRIAEGVYGAIYSEMKYDPVQSNSLIIIGEDAVCVVDAHYTPSAARETIAAIRRLTPLPVRYLVTTHWHDDHVFGNQAYREAFPGLTIIAHRNTRRDMQAHVARHRDQLIASYGAGVSRLEGRLARGVDDSGKPLSADDRARFTARLPTLKSYLADFRSVAIVLPDQTFDSTMVLRLGKREVQILSFGPGNTEGDAIVWLPRDRIAAVGDLVVYPVPFIYGGYPSSWIRVLDSVRGLKPAVMVPGHGPVLRDFTYIDQVSGLLQSIAAQTRTAVAAGKTLEQTREAMNLSRFHDTFVGAHAEREETFQSSILHSSIQAAYEEATAPP